MKRVMIVGVLILALLALPVAAQGIDPNATPQPTYTPYPTQTPYPTYTPYPTATVSPAAGPPPCPPPRDIPGLDNTIQALADAQIHMIQLQIERIQSVRLNRGSSLLQLPTTHARPPYLQAARVVGEPPDLSRRVGIDSWYSNEVNLPAYMVVSVRVDVYDGPQGVGYLLYAQTKQNGWTWERVINIGPEEWRAYDWRIAE